METLTTSLCRWRSVAVCGGAWRRLTPHVAQARYLTEATPVKVNGLHDNDS
ncbi:hypothetical protein E2C01_092857 [Portunus trituberculatus]|uniref:Uncharacterized protein n=1 Tax=Portunus trituberculatus TaxID=210409 RepID=A0A5B7JX17_PORTR|nr:hypothetical protein [Portunus trituberculatus]